MSSIARMPYSVTQVLRSGIMSFSHAPDDHEFHPPATDLGYRLHKNPARVQSFELPFGKAHVFYPEARNDRCTAALLLDIDPVGLVRTKRGPAGEGGILEQYVDDRPYVASSFMSVAISGIRFRTSGEQQRSG